MPPLARLRLRWQPPGGGTSILYEENLADHDRALGSDTAWAATMAMAAWAQHLRGQSVCTTADILRLAEAGDADGRRQERLELLRRQR